MHLKNISKLPIPLGIGVLLWSISGTLTVSLFLDLAGSNPFKIILAVLWAAGLEASKMITWRRGGQYRILSVALMGITLFSALGIALSTVDETQYQQHNNQIDASPAYQRELQTQRDLQSQISILVARLKVLPADYITVTGNLNHELARLRGQLKASQKRLVSLAQLDKNRQPSGTFERIGTILHVKAKILEVIVILILAILTEASAATMAGHPPAVTQSLGEDCDGHPNAHPMLGDLANPILNPTQSLGVTPESYLMTALDHPNAPKLLGRLQVAKRLGISEAQARTLLEELIKTGKVQRGAKSFESSGNHPAPIASNNL